MVDTSVVYNSPRYGLAAMKFQFRHLGDLDEVIVVQGALVLRQRLTRLTTVVWIAMMSIAVTACVVRSQGAVAADTRITIGTSVSWTGSYQKPSMEQFQGLQLWQDHVNAAGGILVGDRRVKVDILSYDDASEVSRTRDIYERLIYDDRVDFLFSPYSSSLGAAVAEVATKHGKIALLPGSASEEIFAHGYTSVYQLYPRGSSYFTPAVISLASQNPSARVAFLYKDDPFSRSTVAGARDLAGELGLTIVSDVAYDEDTQDFTDLLVALAASQPDALIGGGHVEDGLILARQLIEAGIQPSLVSLLAAPASRQFAELGDAAVGFTYPSPWEPGLGYEPTYGPTSDAFVEAYQNKYGTDPEYFGASGYNAGLILQHAIETAGSLDDQAVRDALDATDLVTFYGHIKFANDLDRHGLQIGHTGIIVQWKKDAAGRLVKEVVWAPPIPSRSKSR